MKYYQDTKLIKKVTACDLMCETLTYRQKGPGKVIIQKGILYDDQAEPDFV
jgi:hypothetical protein